MFKIKNKNLTWIILFIIGGIAIIIQVGVKAFFILFLIVIISLFVAISIGNSTDKEKIKDKNREEESIKVMKKKYNNALQKTNMSKNLFELKSYTSNTVSEPKNAYEINTNLNIFGKPDNSLFFNDESSGHFLFWLFNNKLYFMPTWSIILAKLTTRSYDISKFKDPDDITLTTIPLEKVESYRICGNLSTSSYTSSGGSSGINVKGAVKGAVIAGGVGAIIGSQKSTEPTTTSISTDDERYVLLKYFDDNNNSQEIKMSLNTFDLLRKWIPEKEFDFIIQQKQNGILKEKAIKNSIKNNKDNKEIIKQKLKNLSELKQENLISEDDFNIKKQEILNSI